MTTTMNDRRAWPFASLLPWSVMYNYPPPQLMPGMTPCAPSDWPPAMTGSVSRFKSQTDSLGPHFHQIYVHVPFCPFICDFCPFYKIKGPRTEQTESYTASVIREIELYGKQRALADREYSVIYFGGGTPTELSPAQLGRILGALRTHFNVRKDVEVTLESVARHLTAPGYLEACLKEGFNRVSFGIQSLDPNVRKAIGRTGDSIDDYPKAVEIAQAIDRKLPVNIELLHGCPEQSMESFESDLKQVIAWDVGSIDPFSYILMPGTPLYKKVLQGTSPPPRYGENLLDQRRLAQQTLEAAGYKQMAAEMFKKNDQGRFSQSFYGGGGNGMHTVLPLGPSAIGHVDGTIYRNAVELGEYQKIVAQDLLPITGAQRMTRQEVRRRGLLLAVAQLFVPFPLVESFREKRSFRKWEQKGLVERTEKGWRVTAEGTLWYNQMQMHLLPIKDCVSNLRLVGSLEDQHALLRSGTPLGDELSMMARSYGGAGTMALLGYRMFLKTSRWVPSRWSSAVSWLGRPMRGAVRARS